jgi:hypothetical protein
MSVGVGWFIIIIFFEIPKRGACKLLQASLLFLLKNRAYLALSAVDTNIYIRNMSECTAIVY